MKGSDFVFDGINFLYYDFNKTSIYRGGTYIDSAKWLKDKRSTINPKNKDNKCFQYAATLALNIDKINKDPQRISKIKPFIDQYNWKFLSCDMIRTYSQMHRTDKYSQHSSIIWPVWLSG